MNEEFLWTEKYRPKTIEETILPDNLKNTFKDIIKQGKIPNIICYGGPGTGKSSISRAMVDELNSDYIMINGSLNGNIDTLRNDIQNFVSTVSLTGGRKYVIINEADYLNPNSTQPAFRQLIDDFSNNASFILTCNYKNRIIEPIQSRCSLIEFNINKSDIPKLSVQFLKRLEEILTIEGIISDRQVLIELIKKHFPDYRRILNEVQRYSVCGSINSGILSNIQEVSMKELVNLMKTKNFTGLRKWVSENIHNDQGIIFRKLFDNCSDYLSSSSIPQLVLILSKYQYQVSFCADAEINLMACLVECMVELEFI